MAEFRQRPPPPPPPPTPQPSGVAADAPAGPNAPGRWFVGGSVSTDRQAFERAAQRELRARFALGPVLHRGPASVLFDARDLEGDRRVALRVVSRPALAEAGLEERMARALSDAATLDHPNIVAIQRSGASAPVVWYAMEFVEGHSLAQLLRDRGPLDLRLCLRIVEQIASALQYAHRRGVVHGDVHPANVFLFGPGWVLVSDFAVARVLDGLPETGRAPEEYRPVYRAPEEEATELPPTAVADQYALGLTIWECLTGAPPGTQDQDRTLVERLATTRPDLPPHLGAALARALRARPSERFPSVQDLVHAMMHAPAAPAEPPAAMPNRASEPSPSNQRLLFVEYPRRRVPRRLVAGVVATAAVLAIAVTTVPALRRPDPFAPAVPVLAPGVRSPAAASPDARAAVVRPAPARPETAGVDRPADGDNAAPAEPPAEPAEPPAELEPSREVRSAAPEDRRSARTTRAAEARRTAAAPVDRPTSPAATIPGRLFVSSRPWAQLYLDGQLVGNTPLSGVSVAPGVHLVRVVRPGFRPYERELRIEPGQDVRLVDLVLEVVTP